MSQSDTTRSLFSVADKTIVVTGGLGQLGQQYAHGFLEAGSRVAIIDTAVDDDRVPPLLEPWRSSDRLVLIAADVTDRGRLDVALDRVETSMGTPFGLINNAAIDAPPGSDIGASGRFEDYSAAVWSRTLDVNLTGVFLCCQVFGARMAASGEGSIVNISSIYGVCGPDQRVYEYRRRLGEDFYKPPAYSASKAGVIGLTRYLATYWGHAGVRVNALTLGGVRADQDPEFVRAYEQRVPLGRMAEPNEYTGAVMFLMSDAGRYMTGANVVIDGGWTAW